MHLLRVSAALLLPLLLASCGEARSASQIKKREQEIAPLLDEQKALEKKLADLKKEEKKLAPLAKTNMHTVDKSRAAAELEQVNGIKSQIEASLTELRATTTKLKELRQ